MTAISNKIYRILCEKKSFYILLALNFIISVVVFYLYRNQKGSDFYSYMGLADGLAQGKYSYWWFLPEYIPDTVRNPGYPLFLYALKSIYNNVMFVITVQLALYFTSIWMITKIIDKHDKGYGIKNLFLLMLIPHIQFPIYAALIFPEILTLFLITLFIYIDIKMDSSKWLKYILSAFLFGCIFQVRPIFFFLPFLKFAVDWVIKKREFPFIKNVIVLVIFLLTTIPYGYWNYKHHEIFKITSLEGGAGLVHAGYWAFKMPNYTATRYWITQSPDEIISFVNKRDIDKNINIFNKEWDYIDSHCAEYLTHRDEIMLNAWKTHPELFKTYNAKYTIEREKLLRESLISYLKKDMLFMVKTKIYTAVRLWVTGIQVRDVKGTKNIAEKIKAVYPFFITLITFLLAVIFIPHAFIKKKIAFSEVSMTLLSIIYFGLIYIPFSVQARYTIPVRMLLLFLISYALIKLFCQEENCGTYC